MITAGNRWPGAALAARSMRSLAKAALPYRMAVGIRARRYWRAHPDELRLIELLADRDRAAIEIGAADGLYAWLLARRCRHLYAYEPNPDFFAVLRGLSRRNISLSPYAISDREGALELRIPRDRDGRERPLEASLERRFGDDCRKVALIAKPLDALEHRSVGFIKIDVEGHEAAVLRGAARTISHFRPRLWIEIEQRHLNRDIHEVLAAIESMGYEGFFHYQKKLISISQFDLARHQLASLDTPESPLYVNNFAFIPKEEGSAAIVAAWR
jgi:FkbM family methyltransferase